MKPIRTSLIIMLFISMLTAPSSAGIVYENSLQNGIDYSWITNKGSWNWTEQGLSNINHTENRLFLNLMNMINPSQGYSASFSSNLIQGQGWGFFFSSSIDNTTQKVNGYSFQYDPGLGGYVLRSWKNDSESLIKTSEASLDYGNNYKFSLEINQSSLTVTQDGVNIFNYTGNLSPYGAMVGFRTWRSTDVVFQNMTVRNDLVVPESPSLIVFLCGGLTSVFFVRRQQ